MAKQCIPVRNEKRRAQITRDLEKRKALKAIISSETVSFDEKRAAMFELTEMKRDGSKVRLVNRCAITGRPHGVFRAVGICRNKFREMAANGELPGFTKSSW